MAYGRSLTTWKMRFLVMSSRASESVANTSASSSSVLIDNGNEDFFVICCRIAPSTWINSKSNIRLHIYILMMYIVLILYGQWAYTIFMVPYSICLFRLVNKSWFGPYFFMIPRSVGCLMIHYTASNSFGSTNFSKIFPHSNQQEKF